MNRKEFRQLLKRYLKDACTEEERAWVDHWYELLYDHRLPPVSASELDQLEDEIWAGIVQEGGVVPKPPPVRRLRPWYYAAAAVILAVVAGLYFLYPSPQPVGVSYEKVKARQGLQERVNDTRGVQRLQLEDGSTVSLQPGARIAFPAPFGAERREVYLEGAAFFDVTKNAGRPFFVYHGPIVTQVLGTSFDVRTDRATGAVSVAVVSGKVAVYEQVGGGGRGKKNHGVIVTPNQKVVYDAGSRLFETALVDEPQPIATPRRDPVAAAPFAFDEAKLSEVLGVMEKVYGIEIIAENEKLYDCLFTGDLTHQPLYTRLEIICQSVDAAYEIKGTRILVKGKGCSPGAKTD